MKQLLPLATLFLSFPAAAQEAEPPTPGSVVAAASADEWIAIAPLDLLVMDLAPDAAGRERRVVIQLMPPPFSQPWVENIRKLAAAHWWDGKTVYRVVDNWVTQWGGGDPELGMDPGPLPEGVGSPDADYESRDFLAIPDPRGWPRFNYSLGASIMRNAMLAANGSIEVPDAFAEPGADASDDPLAGLNSEMGDNYAPLTSLVHGWPIAGSFGDENLFWPIHCYAHVGVARDLAPDTGTGSELYAVIGHAPRQLDRNIAVVGRVIEGIAHLSVLPRGTGDAGVYEDRAEDTPILSVRLASEMADPPSFEYLDTSSESFARYVQVRANRNDAFYEVPAGGVDICNVQVPIRQVEDRRE